MLSSLCDMIRFPAGIKHRKMLRTLVPAQWSLSLQRLPKAVYRVLVKSADVSAVRRAYGRLIIHPSQYGIRGLHHGELRVR